MNKGEPGVSLRDWLAGQALAGLIAAQEEHWSPEDGPIKEWGQRVNKNWAEFCYDMADAMLKARETGHE